MRPVVRALIAACLATVGLVLAVPAARASTREIQQPSARTYPATSHSLTISIDKVNPTWVTPKHPSVTVSGTLSNHTGSAISGVVVQALTSSQPFTARSEMTSFASGGPQSGLTPTFTPDNVTTPVANGATVRWSLKFDSSLYYGGTSVAVYPIEVRVSAVSGYDLASDRTLVPYWPGKSAAKPLQTGWVWPLIDTPQQGACGQTLATNSLASSLAAGGRLSRLLDSGLSSWALQDQLTWAIDPALLSDATVMTHRYFTGGNSICEERTPVRASTEATAWLSALRIGTAGEPAFLTPYANVDAAALSHAGRDADLRSAYQIGRKIAGQILPGTFGTSGEGSGDGAVLAAAWPTGGKADRKVLTSLVSDGGINTVVLKSGALPSSSSYDDARARTTTDSGTPVRVLLADSTLTSLLGSASNRSPAAARFDVTQGFLAQTAMIAAEGPNEARTLVVAPPPAWSPSRAEAAKLLSMTKNAPWLSPTRLSTLAAEAARVPAHRLKSKKVRHAELSDAYLDQVSSAESSLGLFESLLYRPKPSVVTSLSAALAATESSAWRGAGSPGGWLAVTKLADYLRDEEHRVQIIASKKILLAGTTGTTPVSVQNGLRMPIRVQVRASTPRGSALTVGPLPAPLLIAPGKTNTVRLPVHSGALGTTTMKLQLVTSDGSPLTWTAQPLSVEVTRFGRALLLVIGGALAVLVLTAGVRLRRRRAADGGDGGDSPDSTDSTHGANVSAGAGGAG